VFVPDAAIATDQTTRMVFVVDDKSVVHRRPIVSGILQNGLRRVTSGLDGSETIVVSGAQRVRPDTPVEPHSVSIPFAAWKPVAASTSQPGSQAAGDTAGGAL
jgi:hypothetical protein